MEDERDERSERPISGRPGGAANPWSVGSQSNFSNGIARSHLTPSHYVSSGRVTSTKEESANDHDKYVRAAGALTRFANSVATNELGEAPKTIKFVQHIQQSSHSVERAVLDELAKAASHESGELKAAGSVGQRLEMLAANYTASADKALGQAR